MAQGARVAPGRDPARPRRDDRHPRPPPRRARGRLRARQAAHPHRLRRRAAQRPDRGGVSVQRRHRPDRTRAGPRPAPQHRGDRLSAHGGGVPHRARHSDQAESAGVALGP
ncbi:hypothetical protein OO17_18895 [Rhodopseudomonas palustris]|uniref:Uncharacterized protein n=1 Tax=Rhodopseudomonas palustris TaxID=1076 RepID=A0A0D7EGN2_RHOPL|nr:hypothetical protein OO17_18895 [Rhodopseudomonas palustris]